jgi:hypothetical protein
MSRNFREFTFRTSPKPILHKYLNQEMNYRIFSIALFENNLLNNAIYNDNYDLAKKLIEEGNKPDIYSLPLVNMESAHLKDFIYLLAYGPNDYNRLTQYTIENALNALIYIEDPTLLNNYLQSIIKSDNRTKNFINFEGYDRNDYRWIDKFIKLIKHNLQYNEGNRDELNIMLKLFYAFRFRFCNKYKSAVQLIQDLQSLGIKTLNGKILPNIYTKSFSYDNLFKQLAIETIKDLCNLLESDLDFKVNYYNDNVDFSLIKPAVIKNRDDDDDDDDQ